MNPYMTTILIAAGLVLLFIVWIFYEERKRKKTILRNIRRNYGAPSERQYETGDMEKISHYFRRRCRQEFVIDDITWNDLDMDRVYQMVNQTMSSPGEDVLYDMMRRPLFSQEEVDDRERLIDFFSSHAKEREEMQLLLSKVGKTRLGSLSDTVLELNEAPKASVGIHIVMLALLLGSLAAALFVYPVLGFFLLMVLMIVNIVIFSTGRDRKLIEAYLDCFAHLFGMLSAADDMEKVKWP